MVEYSPEMSLHDMIKEARKSIEKDEFDDAINLYRSTIYEFLWMVRSIKIIDSPETTKNIFLFWDNLEEIFKLLNDIEAILLMDKTRYSFYVLISEKIPSDKSELAKRIYKEIPPWQRRASERPEKALIEEEKLLSISERKEELGGREEELERALTEMEKLGVFEREEKIERALAKEEKSKVLRWLGKTVKWPYDKIKKRE